MAEGSNGNGNISVRTLLGVCLGIIQAMLTAGGYMLYDQISDTNHTVIELNEAVLRNQIDQERRFGAFGERLSVIEDRANKQP